MSKDVVQVLGCMAYLCIVLPFLIWPNLESQTWGWPLLIFVYFMYGAGRATFEGTLKAIFAEYFSHELEGAYSNIVLQSGLTSFFGFIFTYWGLQCNATDDDYFCVQYYDGKHHNVLVLELAVAITSILAIAGVLRAAQLYKQEKAL